MADTAIAISAGTGTNVDTRTEATNGNHRQVIVIGDPSTNAGVAAVDVTNGLSVNVTNSSLTVGSHAVTNAGTFAVQAAITAGATNIAKAEDAASADADVGVPSLAVRKATPANTSGTDGDYEFLQMSAGRLWTNSLLGDGTNPVAVKAASTAAVATDPALVVTLSPNGVNTNGQTTKVNSAPVVPASDWVYNTGYYVPVAASQIDSVIQSSTGATGDYLDGILVIPATTSPGVVTIKDNSTAIVSYPGGGTTALLTLTPFWIKVGAVSRSGAWKVTTGANVSILATGRFS